MICGLEGCSQQAVASVTQLALSRCSVKQPAQVTAFTGNVSVRSPQFETGREMIEALLFGLAKGTRQAEDGSQYRGEAASCQ